MRRLLTQAISPKSGSSSEFFERFLEARPPRRTVVDLSEQEKTHPSDLA